MGLFSILKDIGKAIPGPIGSALSAGDSKKAVRKANDATQLGITNAKGDLNSQLAASQQRLDPYETTGTDALSAIRDLTGLNGNAASGSAIDALKSSPLYTALFNNGRDSVLAAGSATGGLRGGDINGALYNNAEQTLAQVLQQHLQDLGGLSSQGLGATEFGANLGAANANSLGQLDVGSGQSNAGAILGKQTIDNSFFSGLRAQIANAVTAGAGGGAGGAAGGAGGSGGFDLGSALQSLFSGSKGANPGQSPLSNVSGGGFNNSTPTGYQF